MIPKSTDIEYFKTVAETLNLSRAADRLGVGQPTLTQSIKRLEDIVGEQLFVRQRIGVRLTRSGQIFYEGCNDLLNLWNTLASTARKSETEVIGQFTIGCHPAVAQYSLPAIIPKLVKEYPGVSFKLVHELSRSIVEQVISFKIDFGIVINPVRHPDLVLVKLAEDRVSFWRADGAPSDVLLYEPDLLQSQFLLKRLKKLSIEFTRSITSNDLDVLANLASAGAGVCVLPARVARRYSGLRLASSSYPSFADEVHLVYRADRQTSHGAKTVISAVKDAFNVNRSTVRRS